MDIISVKLIRRCGIGFLGKVLIFQSVTFFLILYIDVVLGWGVEAASPRRSGLGGFGKIC